MSAKTYAMWVAGEPRGPGEDRPDKQDIHTCVADNFRDAIDQCALGLWLDDDKDEVVLVDAACSDGTFASVVLECDPHFTIAGLSTTGRRP